MEDVDNITLQTLRAIGVDIDEEIKSVSQLTADTLVEATAMCLERIHPMLSEEDPLPHRLPASLSVRFNVAHRLSQLVKGDGYKGDLGYQTFLYPNERDTRTLLMFLVEHLPKDMVNTTEELLSSSVVLARVVAETMKTNLIVPWLPWYCRSRHRKCGYARRLIVADVATEGIAGRLASRVPAVHFQVRKENGFNLPQSLLERSADVLSVEQLGGRNILRTAAGTAYNITEGVREQRKQALTELKEKRNDELIQKTDKIPDEKIHAESEVQQEIVGESQDERRERQEKETIEARETLVEVERRLERLEGKRERLNAKLAGARSSVNEMKEKYQNLRQEVEAKRKAAAMLPSATENAVKLEKQVEEIRLHKESVETEWASKSMPILAELTQLRSEMAGKRALSQMKEAELEEARTALRECTEDVRKRDEQLVVLRQKIEKLEAAPNRSHYTRRILDIVANIKKQKLEVDRVLAQTRALQKEINTVSGKLERTFTETDELVFRDARSDDTVRTAYKLLASLHSNCETLVVTEEERGSFLRETRELEEQVEGQRRRTQEGQLETVAQDCEQMRTLNENLKKSLKTVGNPVQK